MPKNEMSHNEAGQPMVGIFWKLGSRIITRGTPLDEAERYGDCLTSPVSHIDYWTELQASGEVPKDLEYEEPPRGRVVHVIKDSQFLVYADQCILNSPAAVRAIIARMNLSAEQVKTGLDSHYRCYRCLGYLDAEST